MKISPEQTTQLLDYLNIAHRGEPNYKGWKSILCPDHDDTNFGNASINVDTGVIFCFSCGYKKHIVSLLHERVHIDNYPEFLSFLEVTFLINTSNVNFHSIKKDKTKLVKQSKNYDVFLNEFSNFHTILIEVDKYKYMVDRGFTNLFCDTFNIKKVSSGMYADYFAIPIIDTEKNLVTIEYRKLCEDAYYKKYFKTDVLEENYKATFKEDCKENNIHVDKGILYKNGREHANSNIKYLLKPKVLYEKYSAITQTFWNIDNIDFNEDVYLCEGFGSVAKLYQYISSNSTCTFGSNVYRNEEQVDYLKKFKKRIILIPDNDIAGDKMIIELNKILDNLYICKSEFEDTDKDYVDSIVYGTLISSAEYVANIILTKEIVTNK